MSNIIAANFDEEQQVGQARSALHPPNNLPADSGDDNPWPNERSQIMRPQGNNDPRRILISGVRYFPIFTIMTFFLTWMFFIWGIYEEVNTDQSSSTSPMNNPLGLSWVSKAASPPFETFFFMVVNDWPSCSSARSNTWRLVSYQFVHNGIQHLLGNSVYLLIYGCICEITHPNGTLAAFGAYQLGIVLGALSYAFVWPFDTLVGCSAGVYGLLGCLLAHVILNRDILSPKFHFWLVMVLSMQASWDLLTYFYLYSPSIGYAAHSGGLYFSFLFGLSLGIFKEQEWKKLLALVGVSLLFITSFILTYRFFNVWPPQIPTFNPTLHSAYYPINSCCGDLFEISRGDTSATVLNSVRSKYYCRDDELVRSSQPQHR